MREVPRKVCTLCEGAPWQLSEACNAATATHACPASAAKRLMPNGLSSASGVLGRVAVPETFSRQKRVDLLVRGLVRRERETCSVDPPSGPLLCADADFFLFWSPSLEPPCRGVGWHSDRLTVQRSCPALAVNRLSHLSLAVRRGQPPGSADPARAEAVDMFFPWGCSRSNIANRHTSYVDTWCHFKVCRLRRNSAAEFRRFFFLFFFFAARHTRIWPFLFGQ